MARARTGRPDALALRVELLEERQFLSSVHFDQSAVLGEPVLPASAATRITASAAGSGLAGGLTPTQVRHAYGFDKIRLGSAPADGSGQTIAIVNAFDHPTIESDLHVFSAQFGLPDVPQFIKLSQTGGSTQSLATDAGWAQETALDVQWAHAIAPGANIVLVEANSDSIDDLMAAVDTARKVPGVTTVSMSWGTSEFWGQSNYARIFTAPAGHPAITFVAAAGDDGSAWGPIWPSSSPRVLSVGGTALRTADASGTYRSETAWSDGGGGTSIMEREPSYQSRAQSSGWRTVPDVAFAADTNVGFTVYDSYQSDGWQVLGGTSAGAPQWAALVAIADQGRALVGRGPLDGATATLPTLYSLYSAPGTRGYTTYASDFHDVTSGHTSWSVTARKGYDRATGLGTPQANLIVQALISSTARTSAAVRGVITAHGARIARPAIRPFREEAPPAPLGDIHGPQAAFVPAPPPTAAPANPSAYFFMRPATSPFEGVNGDAGASSSSAVYLASAPAATGLFASDVAGDGAIGRVPMLASSGTGDRVLGSLVARLSAPPVMNIVAAAPDASVAAAALAPGDIGSLMLSSAGSASRALAGVVLTVPHLQNTLMFADALYAFATDSAALGEFVATATPATRTAWLTTAAVLGLDGLGLAWWLSARRAEKKRRQQFLPEPVTLPARHPRPRRLLPGR